MYYEHSPGSSQSIDPPTSNPLGTTAGKRHSEVFFRQSKGFAEWFCIAWIKLSPMYLQLTLPPAGPDHLFIGKHLRNTGQRYWCLLAGAPD